MSKFMQNYKKVVLSFYNVLRNCFYPNAGKLIHSLPEIYYDKKIASGIREMSEIRHAQAFQYGENTELPPWFRQEHAFAERHLYRLKEVELLLPCGGVRFCGKWVQESFGLAVMLIILLVEKAKLINNVLVVVVLMGTKKMYRM